MRKQKKTRLEPKGWKIGSVKEFLGLSNEESAYIELKIKLAAGLRQRQQQKGLSQLDLAGKLQSSQSRVAKMEAGDPIGFPRPVDPLPDYSRNFGPRAVADYCHSVRRLMQWDYFFRLPLGG